MQHILKMLILVSILASGLVQAGDAYLSLTITTPSEVEVYVDGRIHSKYSDAAIIPITSGSHHISFRGNGYQAEDWDISPSDGETLAKEVKLVPIQPPIDNATLTKLVVKLSAQVQTLQQRAEEQGKLSSQVQNLYNAQSWNLVYGNNETGETTYGSLANLVSAVKQGKDVKVAESQNYFICDWVSITADNNSVACMNTQHVSVRDINPGTTFGFQDNAYHWFVMVNTKGQRDMSRWSIGEHADREHTTDSATFQWFVRN